MRPFFQSLSVNDFQLEAALEFGISGFIHLLTFCFAQNETLDTEKIVSEVWPLLDDVMRRILIEGSV